MSYKSYTEARADWIPADAEIRGEYIEASSAIVVYTWKGNLNIDRFFTMGESWMVSNDYSKRLQLLATGSDS